MASIGSDESKKNADEGSIPLPEPPTSTEHPDQKADIQIHPKEHDEEFAPNKGAAPTSEESK